MLWSLDSSSLFIWDINYRDNKNKFISAFAANDPDSTMKVWKLVVSRENGKKCIFLNTRNDRRYRTIQLVELVLKHIKPDNFIIRGDDVHSILKEYKIKGIKLKVFNMVTTHNEIIDYLNQLDKYTIVGIGHIVGWGDRFIREIKKYRL